MKRTAPPSIDAVVAGYLGVDLAPRFSPDHPRSAAGRIFRPGKLVVTQGLDFSLGGVVANTGFALKKFGRRVELMGRIGTDGLGDIAARLLLAQGIKHGIRRIKGARTGHGIVLAPPGTDRMFFEDPGCNDTFAANDIDSGMVRRSRLLHFGYPPLMKRLWIEDGAELIKLLRRVKRLGVATSVDLALPDPDSAAGKADWRAILAGVLPSVDIFTPSVEELLFMLEPQLYARMLRRFGDGLIDRIPARTVECMATGILASGVQAVMIKAGARGAYFRTGNVAALGTALAIELPPKNWSHRSLWINSYPADPRRIRNANGAGDCAVAGFLGALLSGATLERAAQYAMLAGRDNLYGADAYSGLRDWRAMTRSISRGKRP